MHRAQHFFCGKEMMQYEVNGVNPTRFIPISLRRHS